jgi:hypothetical protein
MKWPEDYFIPFHLLSQTPTMGMEFSIKREGSYLPIDDDPDPINLPGGWSMREDDSISLGG